jgi:hypothetical protein
MPAGSTGPRLRVRQAPRGARFGSNPSSTASTCGHCAFHCRAESETAAGFNLQALPAIDKLEPSHEKANLFLKVVHTYQLIVTHQPAAKPTFLVSASEACQKAIGVATNLGDQRALTYGLGQQGALYELDGQPAEALGVSRSTFNRRILPLVETVEMAWGARLIPVDELQRVIVERRRPARAVKHPRASPGRPATVALSIVERIRVEHAAGRSLAQIARELNADQVPTAHGGAQWWPSTVRAVIRRSAA